MQNALDPEGAVGRGEGEGAGCGAQAAEPGALVLGEAPGFDLDLFDGVFEVAGGRGPAVGRKRALDDGDELLVAEGFAGLGCEGVGFDERADLVEQAALHHEFDAGVDARVEDFGGVVEEDELEVGSPRSEVGSGRWLFVPNSHFRLLTLRTVPLGLACGDGDPGLPEDLERADGAAGVVGVDAGRRGGIDALEFGAAGGGVHGGEFGTELWVGFGSVEEAFEEGLDVEVGAADDDGEDVVGAKAGDGLVGAGEPGVEGEGGTGFRVSGFGSRVGNEIYEMMRYAPAFGGGGFGGADVEAGVDLEGVGGDDLGADGVLVAEGDGEIDGEVGLAAGGGAADDGGEGENGRIGNHEQVKRVCGMEAIVG